MFFRVINFKKIGVAKNVARKWIFCVCLEHFFKTRMKETEQIRRRWYDNNKIVRNELDCRVRERIHLPKLQFSSGNLLT
jgi:hypothetical protein